MDTLSEVYKNNVKGKVYRLLYQMNKDTHIRVKTPVGYTEERSTGEGIGQGTLEGAVLSSVNLDGGVRDYFKDSCHEVNYADIQLGPLLYQDDIKRLSDDIPAAQLGVYKLEQIAESKLLDFNIVKSSFLVIGSKKGAEEY